MHLNRIRHVPIAMASAAILAFAAACSGPVTSLSPTSPTGVAATTASSSAVSGTMDMVKVPPCDPTKQTCEPPPPPDPCKIDPASCEPPPPPDPCKVDPSSCEPPPPPDPCQIDPKSCEPPPPPPGDDGCTPGYWKNHLRSWTGYSPSATLTSVFGPNALDGTLQDGLGFGGGSGVTGAKRILLRAAVAALLNAAHGNVDYTRTTTQVITAVTSALDSNNRETMLTLASSLDRDNNLGCPLN